MSEEDRAHTLAVFRTCLPRRGRKAADDRRFLEALHFFTVENVRWRALPKEFGHWNSVWKRFDRLRKAGVFEALFDLTGDRKALLRGSRQTDTASPEPATFTLSPVSALRVPEPSTHPQPCIVVGSGFPVSHRLHLTR